MFCPDSPETQQLFTFMSTIGSIEQIMADLDVSDSAAKLIQVLYCNLN